MRKHRLILIISIILLIFQKRVSAQEVKFNDLANTKKGEYKSYVASDGAVYKVGEKIKIGVPTSGKNFTYIKTGDGVFTPITYVSAFVSNSDTEINNIVVMGTKKSGFFVVLVARAYGGLSNYQIYFENALSTGEIKGKGMSSDEALNELKRQKDKLELGLITQEEYDKIKTELSKYIK